MNTEKLKKLAVHIEDKSYFHHGLKWHEEKYIYPIYSKNIYLISLFIVIITALLLFSQIKDWYPLSIQKAIILENDDIINKKQFLTKMSDKYKNSDYAVLEYLLRYYIKLNEEYIKGSLDILSLDRRVKKIAGNSTPEVTKKFQKIFEANDSSNVIYRVGVNGSRLATIENFELIGVDESFLNQFLKFGNVRYFIPSNAIAKIKVVEKSLIKETVTEFYNVNIDFVFSGVIFSNYQSEKDGKMVDHQNIEIPQFYVTNYNKTKL